MAEQKKKKNPLLERFKRDMNTKEDLAKLQNKAKLESLASSGNKKLSEPAKKQLKINQAKDEDDRATKAMNRSRQTVEALSNRATLKNYGGYSGPAETETKVDNPAKPKPKPKPKPAAVKPVKPPVSSNQQSLTIPPKTEKTEDQKPPKEKPKPPKTTKLPPGSPNPRDPKYNGSEGFARYNKDRAAWERSQKPKEGQRARLNGKPVVYRNGKWVEIKRHGGGTMLGG